jgi:hypothetical protein
VKIAWHCRLPYAVLKMIQTLLFFFLRITFLNLWPYLSSGGQDSSAGIATRYGLEGPGIESGWGEIFRTYPDRLRGPPSLLYNGYRVSPGGKGGRGVKLTTHSLLVPRLRKSWAIPPLTLWVLLGLLRVPFTFTLYLSSCYTRRIRSRCTEQWNIKF